MTDEKATVEGETVFLDYAELRDTKYFRCKLIYKGGLPPVLTNCDLVECEFVFDGPALHTVHFLRILINTGGRELVLGDMLGAQ